MKICFVIIELDYFVSHRLDLAKNLAMSHEVYVITNIENASDERLKEISDYGINLCHLPGRKGSLDILGYFRYLKSLRNLIKSLKLDFIFYVTLEMSTLGALLNNFQENRKSYFLITGLGPHFFNNKLKYILYRIIQRIIFMLLKIKNNYLFIFQNPDDQKIFIKRKLCDESISTVIQGNGIDTDYFKYCKRNIESEVIFLFASKLIYSKGIIEYINASKDLASEYPAIKFLIAGNYDPSNPDSISKKEFEGIQASKHLEYKGFIDIKKMRNCLYESSVLVLPSYGEGLPKIALEASATGLPLILSDVRGCRDCLIDEKNGLLIKAQNITDLKTAMEKFINQKELINIYGKFSSEVVKKKFSIDIITEKFLKIID